MDSIRRTGAFCALNSGMRRLTVPILVLVFGCRVVASELPLTAKDLSLMLRTGYSSDSVLRELASRHFADVFDAGVETELVKAGASPALVDALRSGVYKVSESEAESAKERLAAQEVARAKAFESSGNGNPQAIPSSSPSQRAPFQQAGGTLYDHLKGDLVYWHNGALVPFDDAELEKKKIYLLFFSAISSKEGRQLTVTLRDYYNRVAPKHPEFEVVFFSVDRSLFAMENYMSETNMPWPAVAYDKRSGKAGGFAQNLVRQIPYFLLAEVDGRALSDSGGSPANLDKVLGDLDKIFAAEK
jgi:hypothetical protein